MDRTPKVFISYSWSTPAHQDWVLSLSERLMSDGVDVTIDKWNLKEGQDKYKFMESMVTSADIDRVLIILDKKYAEKANVRAGGVGTETQIISPKIYSNVSQEKFIPIVVERGETGETFVPTYLESRIYIDLSEAEDFETNYEQLLRNIYQRPTHAKPVLGKAPSYLFDQKITAPKITAIIKSTNHILDKHPQKINPVAREFFDNYFNAIQQFKIEAPARSSIDYGRQIIENLGKYIELRNDFIYFLTKVVQEGESFDRDIVIRFLERINLLKDPLDDRGSWSSSEFYIFYFIIHELFIYIVALALKAENYIFLEDIFYTKYLLQDRYQRHKEPVGFEVFYNHTDGFDDYYKQTFSQNLFSPMADFLIKRVPDSLDKDTFIDADILCHYIASFNNARWFPMTYVYKKERPLELFRRLSSLKHFEKTKGLFNVKTVAELRLRLQTLKDKKVDQNYGYSNSFDRLQPIYEVINIESIGVNR